MQLTPGYYGRSHVDWSNAAPMGVRPPWCFYGLCPISGGYAQHSGTVRPNNVTTRGCRYRLRAKAARGEFPACAANEQWSQR